VAAAHREQNQFSRIFHRQQAQEDLEARRTTGKLLLSLR